MCAGSGTVWENPTQGIPMLNANFLGLKIWQSPKSHKKNQLKPFSDVFESPESESEVTLVQKKSSQALENMRALVVRDCTL